MATQRYHAHSDRQLLGLTREAPPIVVTTTQGDERHAAIVDAFTDGNGPWLLAGDVLAFVDDVEPLEPEPPPRGKRRGRKRWAWKLVRAAYTGRA